MCFASSGANGTNGANGAVGATGAQGDIGLGLSYEFQTTSASSYTITLPAGNASVILLATRSGTQTITLPSAATSANRHLVVRKTVSSGYGYVKPGSGDQILGWHTTSEFKLDDDWDQVALVSDGTDWMIFSWMLEDEASGSGDD